MGSIIDSMHGALDDMSHCSGGTTPMHAKTSELDAMTGEHRERMQRATELRGAQDEVRAHHAGMLGLLDSMESMMGGMSCTMMDWD